MRFLPALALTLLAGCTTAETVVDAQRALNATTNAVTVVRSNAPLLTKAQASACAAQAGANVLTDWFSLRGDANAAKYATAASKVAGLGCTWNS